MAKFKDSTGQQWTPLFNVTLAREIRDTCEIDLLTLFGKGRSFARMETDRDLLAKVLWIVCGDSAIEQGLDEAAFCSRLAGVVFEDAKWAVMAAVDEFLMVPEHQLLKPGERPPPQPSVSGQALAGQEFAYGPIKEFSTHREDNGGHISG